MMKKGFVFEEIGPEEKASSDNGQVIKPGILSRSKNNKLNKMIFFYLISLLTLVFLMILLGGLTRLTDSGLSITEWKPLTGVIPPLNVTSWLNEFLKYSETSEFKLQNINMSLEEFKVIYYWEWAHRQLGRLIGLVWFLGFFLFLVWHKVSASWRTRFLILGVLIGVQGFLGWWMVSSGLENMMVDVASYRLAVHLTTAFTIFGLIFWYTLKSSRTEADLIQSQRYSNKKLKILISGLLYLLYIQIFLGGLVAGIDAGTSYTDWPLMGGEVFPSLAFEFQPIWINFLESEALVQFNHRVVGYIIAILTFYIWLKSRYLGNKKLRVFYTMTLIAIFLQILLGVITVRYAAPWHLAIVHQFGAIVLVSIVLKSRFETMFPSFQSVRG
ncbi:MAG: COX15/CtaA family protein [Paracoccaceae bacterium]|jgi:cytochrome c oxidase assembly protein subunit 15|nr:COX15/CtaA family protein [Paracoccaceae bacterium]